MAVKRHERRMKTVDGTRVILMAERFELDEPRIVFTGGNSMPVSMTPRQALALARKIVDLVAISDGWVASS